MLKANIHFSIIQVHYLQTLMQGSLNFPAINLHEGEFTAVFGRSSSGTGTSKLVLKCK